VQGNSILLTAIGRYAAVEKMVTTNFAGADEAYG